MYTSSSLLCLTHGVCSSKRCWAPCWDAAIAISRKREIAWAQAEARDKKAKECTHRKTTKLLHVNILMLFIHFFAFTVAPCVTVSRVTDKINNLERCSPSVGELFKSCNASPEHTVLPVTSYPISQLMTYGLHMNHTHHPILNLYKYPLQLPFPFNPTGPTNSGSLVASLHLPLSPVYSTPPKKKKNRKGKGKKRIKS